MPIQSFKDLIAWQKAMDLVVEVYRATESFPQREMYGLSNQMRRAAVSIPSNIAEGQGRSTTKDFCHFLCHSIGSVQELETQLLISRRQGFMDNKTQIACQDLIAEVGRILHGLLTSLRSSDTSN